MKKRINKNSTAPTTRVRREHFEINFPGAQSVMLAGTFNNRRPEATPMVALSERYWAKDVILPPGNYEYRLVVDGNWIADPAAMKARPNPFGGVNSLRRVQNGA